MVGRYQFSNGLWEIEAEPDIMIKLKRIFPRVAPTVRGTILLTATLEATRDLEWALDRWPMHASAADRQRLRKLAGQHRRAESAIQSILAGGNLPTEADWVQPAVPMREYQRQARDLVWASGGVLVADELGLGKTFTGLGLLESPAARPALAVTLTGVMPKQWRDELTKFYPMLTSIEVQTGEIHSLKVKDKIADLIVINYAKLHKWQYHLKGVVKTVIFDEVQELRRAESDRYKAAVTISHAADFRTGLSATPIYNYGGEIFNIVDALRPGALGTRMEFAREWCGTYGLDTKTTVEDPDALRAHLTAQGLFLRRTREDVGIELPPITTVEQYVPSDQDVLREIDGNAVELARLILDQSANPRERWAAAGKFDWMMRQQTGLAKAPFVADFVKLLLQSEQRVMLLGWHHAVYAVWAERLARYNPCMYTGAETNRQKTRTIEAFKNGDCRVLIMSLRSGAGVDGLQDVASTLVFGELDWSPGPHKQAIGRLGRPGQNHHTMAYFCATDEGSDPAVIETLDIKQMQAHGLIESGQHKAPVAVEGRAEHYERIQKLAAKLVSRVDGNPEQARRTA
ncbi:DNA/RNA helicase, superfamily II, SNF2 family [Mycobacteroides abscessus subsp. abscessus]|nr:DNA/RNA helicase, superfamily II, SNF2 family [Mycobacteroides abscessus subsp. abscessus]SLH39618.1 DNA/RNA helicase, superfamily II, SNF2 family [Mycobacteroides abscessus subsp. abscessus]